MLKTFAIVIGAGLLVTTLTIWAFAAWIDDEQKPKRQEFAAFVEFAKTHTDLREVINYAATTNFTDVRIMAHQPEGMDSKGKDGLPSPDWWDWQQKNSAQVSLKHMEDVEKALQRFPGGVVQFTNPQDNPLQYDRSFLQLTFDGNKIKFVEPRSL